MIHILGQQSLNIKRTNGWQAQNDFNQDVAGQDARQCLGTEDDDQRGDRHTDRMFPNHGAVFQTARPGGFDESLPKGVQQVAAHDPDGPGRAGHSTDQAPVPRGA